MNLSTLSDRDAGRILGAFEARGGVVIGKTDFGDKEYYGVRFYIETLTVTVPLHAIFGDPKVRAAYSRPVYRYELTKRRDVLPVAQFLRPMIFDPLRQRELDIVIEFCSSEDSKGRALAADKMTALRAASQ